MKSRFMVLLTAGLKQGQAADPPTATCLVESMSQLRGLKKEATLVTESHMFHIQRVE